MSQTVDMLPLREFVRAMTALADSGADEARYLQDGAVMLANLVRQDSWLPEAFTQAGPTYRQNLLYSDPAERFCVVAFVWGPGQSTPVHDHTVWGLVGMLRGKEVSTMMIPDPAGGAMRAGRIDQLEPGQVVSVSPNLQDIHTVANALPDRTSISIHVYGGNIGMIRRHIFDAANSSRDEFVSGYSNLVMPNFWV